MAMTMTRVRQAADRMDAPGRTEGRNQLKNDEEPKGGTGRPKKSGPASGPGVGVASFGRLSRNFGGVIIKFQVSSGGRPSEEVVPTEMVPGRVAVQSETDSDSADANQFQNTNLNDIATHVLTRKTLVLTNRNEAFTHFYNPK